MPGDGAGVGVNVGNAAGFAADLIREGESASGALARFREAGGAMRTQSWYRMFGEVRDTLARQPETQSLDPGRYPNADQYSTWRMGKGGQYATQVNIVFRDRDTGLVAHAPFTYITDTPHTPDEAIAAGQALYSDEGNQAKYGQTILGGNVTDVAMTVAFDEG